MKDFIDSMGRIVVMLILTVSGIFFCGQSWAVEIVKKGQPWAKILIAADAPRMVVYAAEEFQAYIKKISGAKLPIQRVHRRDRVILNAATNYVCIGESACTKRLHIGLDRLGIDGFRIIARKNYMVVVGRDHGGEPMTGENRIFSLGETFDAETGVSAFGETGTLYGVYAFLRKYLGVRWFMPGELGEVVQQRNTIRTGRINYSQSPDFTYRRLYFAYGFEEPRYADMVKWYRRAGFGGEYPIDIIHSFREFAEKYGKVHPEYLYNFGKAYPHLVLTEPGVMKQCVMDIRDYFDQHPDRRVYPVMPDDMNLDRDMRKDKRLNGVAEPSMGKRGRFSDYVWGFVNKVAIEVAKTHPGKLIGCCAYADYLLPPKKIDRLNSNVVVMIATTRALNANERYKKSYRSIILEWKKKCKQVYLWEYYNWIYAKGASPGTPVIYPHIIAEDLHFLKGVNRGEFIEAETSNPPFDIAYVGLNHLNYYITARYLWDAGLDIDKVLNDYYKKFYGPAKDEMKKFFECAENFLTERVGEMDIDADHYFKKFALSRGEGRELLRYLKSARDKAGDTDYGRRIDLISREVSNLGVKFLQYLP